LGGWSQRQVCRKWRRAGEYNEQGVNDG